MLFSLILVLSMYQSLYLSLRQSILIMIHVTVQLSPFEFVGTAAAQKSQTEQLGIQTVEPKALKTFHF